MADPAETPADTPPAPGEHELPGTRQAHNAEEIPDDAPSTEGHRRHADTVGTGEEHQRGPDEQA